MRKASKAGDLSVSDALNDHGVQLTLRKVMPLGEKLNDFFFA